MEKGAIISFCMTHDAAPNVRFWAISFNFDHEPRDFISLYLPIMSVYVVAQVKSGFVRKIYPFERISITFSLI